MQDAFALCSALLGWCILWIKKSRNNALIAHAIEETVSRFV
ncbi:hypothetical protein PROPEN_01638 [Proteus penneri ATCC 35198]|nr:hypothetical protein PROPEN_01638 [Proteus penneri ATCC 35198]